MRIASEVLFALSIVTGVGPLASAAAQEQRPDAVPCRGRPCAVVVDWTRQGGIASQLPDRRYGNPARLEEQVKARLTELGFARHTSSDDQALRILLVPAMGSAMCDEMAGTSTDMSCRAITEVQARVEGPDELRRDIDLPGRIRNRCSSDRLMPVDRFAAFLGDWLVYALEGRAKGERRPIARC